MKKRMKKISLIEEISAIESWVNNYPRKIHDYHSAGELFEEEIRKIS